jgi:hypothetical protein
MAQTKTTKDRQPAIDNYNRASRVKQRIIWLYYRGAQTNNSEGISPTGIVGGVTDYSISGNVKYYLTSKQFRFQAKVSKKTMALYCCFIYFISLIRFILICFCCRVFVKLH